MPAPHKFSRAQLRRAALALVDADGLGALTMRYLAAALDAGPITIYNYVTGRDGLEAPDRGESVDVVTDRVRALASEQFPYLIEAAGVAADCTPEREFHAGLDIVLKGLS